MPIVNIIDRRTRPYRFKVVNAIVEAAWHDNSVADSDQVDPYVGVGYDELVGVSLEEAVRWAAAMPEQVALFLYDDGAGTSIATRLKIPR